MEEPRAILCPNSSTKIYTGESSKACKRECAWLIGIRSRSRFLEMKRSSAANAKRAYFPGGNLRLRRLASEEDAKGVVGQVRTAGGAEMARSTPQWWHWIRRSPLFLSAVAIALTPGMVRAQQSAAGHVWHPGATAGGMHPAPVLTRPPVRASVPTAMARTPPAVRLRRWPVSGGRFANAPRATRGVQPVGIFLLPGSGRPAFRAPIFFRPFSFGVGFPGGFGYAGSMSQPGGMPLGFGLWPACDSAATPGVFWTIGPCFGIGDYSLGSTATQNEYLPGTAPPSTYLLPLFFSEEPGPVAQQNPSSPAPAPTMLLYVTDGSTIAASDWWVAHGRLQYITDSGAKGSMDLSQLDLERTIKQNETRGLQFHLRFTPPSERP
jgi:hypothetical protein